MKIRVILEIDGAPVHTTEVKNDNRLGRISNMTVLLKGTKPDDPSFHDVLVSEQKFDPALESQPSQPAAGFLGA